MPGNQWRTAPLPDGQHLLLVQSNAALPTLDEAFAHYEDLTPYHRQLHQALMADGLSTNLVLLSDSLANVHFLDLAREEILIRAHGEGEITSRILPLLTLDAVARGMLHSFPRKSLRQRAGELHDWAKIWMSRIGPTANIGRDAAMQFLFWVLLSRHAELLGIGPKPTRPFPFYGTGRKAPHPVRFLTERFTHLRDKWNLLQGTSMDSQKLVARAAHQQGLLEEFLSSFSRVARSKISAEVFADAFADEELRQVGWRHSLVENPEVAHEGPERWLSGPLVLDIDTVGLNGLIRQFDLITEDMQSLARQQIISRERGERPGMQLDLLGGDIPTFDEEDAPRLVLQQVLRVSTTSRARAEAARLVLLARAAEWHARLWRPHLVFPIPQVEATTPPQPPRQRPWPPVNPSLN